MRSALCAVGLIASITLPLHGESGPETPSVQVDGLAEAALLSSPAPNDSSDAPTGGASSSPGVFYAGRVGAARVRPVIARSRHSILVGGVVGFGIGAVLGATVGAEACLNEPRWHCAAKVGVPIAAIGALLGWLAR